jgi:hypothetical protein
MSSTTSRREKRKAKKEAKRKALQAKLAAEEAERLRKETPKYKRDEKREKLLGDLEQVKGIMTDNIAQTLENYGTVSDIEEQSTNLVAQASQFERQAGRVDVRAYWNKMAKTVYISLIGFGLLTMSLALAFDFMKICGEEGEDDPLPPSKSPTSLPITTSALLNNSYPTRLKEDPAYPTLDWFECPTFWMGMLFGIDVICIILFWFRRKICCCWCDWLRLGRCECCLSCPSECCKKCGR